MTSNFKTFQESVWSRMLDGKGRKIFKEEAMNEDYVKSVYKTTGHGDRKVKFNLRFMNKSFHIPTVQLCLKELTPNPKDIKRKNNSFQLYSPTLPQVQNGQHGGVPYNERAVSNFASSDSVVEGVLVALDYDTEILNRVHHQPRKL